MTGEQDGSASARLLAELEREKLAHERTVAEVERQRGFAHATERLSRSASASAGELTNLGPLLRTFAEIARVDVAVIRVREGSALRSRWAFGLDEEISANFSVALELSFPGTRLNLAESAPPQLRAATTPPRDHAAALGLDAAATSHSAPVSNDTAESANEGDPAQHGPWPIHCSSKQGHYFSEPMQQRGIQTLYCLPLSDGRELIAGIYVGLSEERPLSQETLRLFVLLGVHATGLLLHQAAIEQLQHAIRSRDDVLSVVAHDLQNPINVISIAASILLQRLSDPGSRRPLERIMRGVQRADRMIRDLLEVNSIEAGRFTIQPGRVEPIDLILSALESQQSLAADASVIIGTDLSPHLPRIEADEERLLEVLENLIGNAIKFTNAGGSIKVGAAQREHDILISVTDTGAGISPDQLPHIFDRFWQAKKAHRRGTGLGLTICKAIVEAHGGEIWATSALGAGTSVFFTIPAQPAPSAVQEVPEVANILLVDDRPENLFALQTILDRPDYRIVTAASGEEALRIALRESFAVALVDVAMPGMSGLEVATHLKELERSRDIPIIFITAFGDDPEQIHRAYSAGGADYLVKPLDIEIVRKKVAVFVDLSRRRHSTGPLLRRATAPR
jgi:signal transduction histidine kinase/CheY-like chemotaxis protein